MSNGRRLRRQAHSLDRQLRSAANQPVTAITNEYDGYDSVTQGDGQFIVPTIPDAMPAELKAALDQRRRATLTGRCDCGAKRGPAHIDHDGELVTIMVHLDECPATDRNLTALAEQLGWQPTESGR